MKRLIAATIAVWMLNSGCIYARALLSEHQARNKAIDILRGDPYGRSRVAVEKNIKSARFVRNGDTKACGPIKTAAWEFHVVVPPADKHQFANRSIDGFLALDARTGRIFCANLPFVE
jgi:hypothetical protein